jgi:hypothetical protein
MSSVQHSCSMTFPAFFFTALPLSTNVPHEARFPATITLHQEVRQSVLTE